ncbi:AAA family ATPase [Aureispira anguillae]|uniref:AAA family ATPase n=1 Tax=Aureispira anguillae TaxID=2864201 RepID=A0A915YG76_9BACT|nr:AAA family ATPase [Aureispira anguillae]BDS12439.1 AAA family ATPase [Aureispira anguillae]
MSQVTVNVPVLVQQIDVNNQQQYHISPVFFPNPIAVNRRYEEAVSLFKKEVRDHFKGLKIGRANADYLLWYMFSPQMTHKIIKMDFIAGKQSVKGAFSIIYFRLQNKVFVCLPSFNSFVFVLEEDQASFKGIAAQTQLMIEKLLRVYKKNAGVVTLDMESYYASSGEFVTSLEFKVNAAHNNFRFEQTPDDWMFAFFGGQEDFDGAEELGKVGVNLNELYPVHLKRAWEREELVQQLSGIIYQQENTPIVLVGEEGVGKHSIIHEIVYRFCEAWDKPDADKMSRLWQIDPTRIIAGMSVVGMWQKRFEAILQHLKNRQKGGETDKILISNVVAMLRIGKSSQNSMTLSDVLKPYLEKRLLQVVLVATAEEWKIIQEKDRRFTDLFQVIRINEPQLETAVKMILEKRKRLELQHQCTISIPAVRQLFTIHRNYFKRKALPGSVAKLLTQLAVKYSMQMVDVEQAQEEFEMYSGLSSQIFDRSYVFEENEVRQEIEASLVGQQNAVDCLTNVIHTVKAKLNDPNKPLGSFLFIGPTGVGKTEAAKIVCQYLLGDAKKLMRFDMNEYIDEMALSRLVGDYYNPEGQLTGKIRYNPFGVVLFDEIEKAHPKIHDLLLQVLDDGRLTDALGRTVDFANTIIIMTSNIGASDVDNQLGFQTQKSTDDAIYRKAVENFFRPEFINRIDKTVIFNTLELEHILGIAKLQIQNLLSRDGFVRRTTILNISDEALEWVAQRGFNAKMGGRALKRQIEKDLTAFSAEQLIKTTSDQPLIFDIQLKDGSLYPKIEVLDFVQPLQGQFLPAIPTDTQLKRFYGSLVNDIERIEARLLELDIEDDYVIDMDGEDHLDWQYYDLKNQLAEKKEHANRMLLGFRSKYLDHIVSTSLRLKSAGTSSIIYKRDTTKIDKILLKEQLFQRSALEELRYVYQNAPEQFDKQQSIYLTDYFDVAFLTLKVDHLEREQLDKIEIRIQSAISNQGQEEIKYLERVYKAIFEELDISFQLIDHVFYAEGYGAQQLLRAEQGYHLFYRAHQNPLPICVTIRGTQENAPSEMFNSVIRLYDISLGEEHKASTITDLRTGYTNQAKITANEYKLFLYACLFFEKKQKKK